MALDLMLTVLKHAPRLSGAEFRVLMSIAQEARALDVPRDIGMEQLVVETQMTRSGLRKAFAAMSERGLDVRVPLGKDKHDAPLYAVPGRRPAYVLRAAWFLPPPVPGCTCGRCKVARAVEQGGTTVPPSRGDHSPSSSRRRDHRDRQPGPQSRQAGRMGQAAGTTVPPNTYVSTEGGETYVATNTADATLRAPTAPVAEEQEAAPVDPRAAARAIANRGVAWAQSGGPSKVKSSPAKMPEHPWRPCLGCGKPVDPAAGDTHPGCEAA